MRLFRPRRVARLRISEEDALYVALLLTLLSAAFFQGRADTVTTADGQIHRGTVQLARGEFVITSTNGNKVSVSISNVASVVFAKGPEIIAGEHTLSPPWASQDIGSVGIQGGARQTSNSFAVRASGTGLTSAIDGFHFVYQEMAGDAEIIAHLAEVETSGPKAQAGLVIRQTLGPESADAAVLVSPGNPAAFQYRISRKRANPELHGPKRSAPQWLKLEKKDKFYIGSISEDGKNWSVVGSQTIKLAPTRNLDDQWYIGLAVSSQANAADCTAQFDHVSVRLHGLTTQLFSDEFKTVTKTVVLPNFPKGAQSWDGPRPAAIRCSGQFLPAQSDQYTFSVRASEPCKLWVDDRLAYSSAVSVRERFTLQQSRPVKIRLETRPQKETRFGATVFWATLRHGAGPVVETMLAPDPDASPVSAANESPVIALGRAQAATAGIVLKNGTTLAGEVKEMDETVLQFVPLGQAAQTVKSANVARVQFRPMSPQLAARIGGGVPGILLLNGDFIEGDLKTFKKGQATISSIIFGLHSYDTANQAAAVVLRPFQKAGRFVVRTNKGSALFAEVLEVQENALVVSEPLLGEMRLNASELLDIRRVLPDGG
jgi:hypothetical protein